MLDWKHKLMLVGLLVALILLAAGGYEWEQERETRIKLDATLTAQQAAQKDYQGQVDAIRKEMADRDAVHQEQVQALNQKFEKAATPEQVAGLVGQLMGLTKPIQIQTPAATPANPNPTPVAVVPSVDFPQAKAYFQECETCKAGLAKAAADLKDREAQQALAQKQIDSLKTERDAAVKAVKGTWWGNTKKALKYIGIGAAIGAAATCGSGHCK